MASSSDDIHLYWATGCTSCLRIKEFLERNNIEFVSKNILHKSDTENPYRSAVGIKGADETLLNEMEQYGLPDHVPIVRKGTEWADGKDLPGVADLLDLEHTVSILPVDELYHRIKAYIEATQRYLSYIPEARLTDNIPKRHRSYADLILHTFSIPHVFVMHEAGVPMDSVPRMEHSWDHESTIALSTYGYTVEDRFTDWFNQPGQECDWTDTAKVFWGTPTKHEFFERTTWHTGQHVRQLEWIIVNEFNNHIENRMDPSLFDKLPMPDKVWDWQST